MGARAPTDLPDAHEVAAIQYAFYGLDGSEATKLTQVTIENLTLGTSGGKTTGSGTLVNGLDSDVVAPRVLLYPIDATGRPIDEAFAAMDYTSSLAARSSWDFELSPLDGAVGEYATYFEFGDLAR